MMKQRYKPTLVDPTAPPTLRLVQSDAAEEPPPLPQFVVKTLGELGPNLPVGMLVGGARVRLFRLRPFRMKQEKQLASLREGFKGTPGKFVTEALALMVQTLGPHNFDTMKEGERQLAINRLTMPDVLYIYMWLRRSALGADSPIPMRIRCQHCNSEYQWYGDLDSMDVKVVPDEVLTELHRPFTLQEPIAMRGKTVSKLTLGPIPWDAFCRKEFTVAGSQQYAAILASIVGAEGMDLPPGTFVGTDGDIDDMGKVDGNAIIADIEKHTPGPQLDIEPQCPGCQQTQRMMLDWSWDNFFSRSAQPSR